MSDSTSASRKSPLQVMLEPPFHEAVRLAASRQMMTTSEFTRRCLFDRVCAAGIDPLNASPLNREPGAADAARRHAAA
jgi:hypothetical protein